jgi:hypothetical protein
MITQRAINKPLSIYRTTPCTWLQAAERLKKGLDLVSSDYALAAVQDAMRMWISAGYFRTER